MGHPALHTKRHCLKQVIAYSSSPLMPTQKSCTSNLNSGFFIGLKSNIFAHGDFKHKEKKFQQPRIQIISNLFLEKGSSCHGEDSPEHHEFENNNSSVGIRIAIIKNLFLQNVRVECTRFEEKGFWRA